MSSKAEKIVARALYRVVARNMAAGRSVEYQQLLLETAAEVDVLAAGRRERDSRLLERAQREIREAQMRLAVVAQSRAPGSGDVEQEFRSMAAGPPSWHPEHPSQENT